MPQNCFSIPNTETQFQNQKSFRSFNLNGGKVISHEFRTLSDTSGLPLKFCDTCRCQQQILHKIEKVSDLMRPQFCEADADELTAELSFAVES
jgi:hypothetical protein